jgi:hypothetical protein
MCCNDLVLNPEITPLEFDFRADLLAIGIEQPAPGRFVIATIKPPKNQTYVIKSFVPYAMERTNVGNGATEAFQMLTPVAASGNFSYEVLISNSTPFLLKGDYNTATTEADPATNIDRQKIAAVSQISDHPRSDAYLMAQTPTFGFRIPSGAVLNVIFSVIPVASNTGTAIPNPYLVGSGTKRVDFAGFVMTGAAMTEQVYSRLEKREGARRCGNRKKQKTTTHLRRSQKHTVSASMKSSSKTASQHSLNKATRTSTREPNNSGTR